jgi:hypothetical protein
VEVGTVVAEGSRRIARLFDAGHAANLYYELKPPVRLARTVTWVALPLSALGIVLVATERSGTFDETPARNAVLVLAVVTAGLTGIFQLLLWLVVGVSGLRHSPTRPLSPARDSVAAVIVASMTAFPLWTAVICVLVAGAGVGLSDVHPGILEAVLWPALPGIGGALFLVLVLGMFLDRSLRLAQWLFAISLVGSLLNLGALVITASMVYGFTPMLRYTRSLGFELGPFRFFDALPILILFFLVWTIALALRVLIHRPEGQAPARPAGERKATSNDYVSSARTLSLALFLVMVVFVQMGSSYSARVPMRLEARNLFARSIAYKFLSEHLPSGYYERDAAFEALAGPIEDSGRARDVRVFEGPYRLLFPTASYVYREPGQHVEDSWITLHAWEAPEPADDLRELEIALSRLNPSYDPEAGLYVIDAAVRVRAAWSDGSRFQSYLEPPIGQSALVLALMPLMDWEWLSFGGELAARSDRLAERARDQVPGWTEAESESVADVYWNTETQLREQFVRVPTLGLNMSLANGMWISFALMLGILISIQSRVRAIIRDPGLGRGNPWLVLDAYTRIERAAAVVWVLGILAAPWIAIFMLFSVLVSEVAIGRIESAAFALVQALGVVVGPAVGGWCSFATAILLVRLRVLRVQG